MTTIEIYANVEEKFKQFASLVDKITQRDPKTNAISFDVRAPEFMEVFTSMNTAYSACDSLVKPTVVCSTYGELMVATSALAMIKQMRDTINNFAVALSSVLKVR